MSKKLEKLECQLCGHLDLNLVPHIQKEHADQMTLKEYIRKHCDGKIDGVIHPSLQEKEKQPMQSELAPELQILIPKENEAYQLQAFTKDVEYDIEHKKPVALTGHTGTGKTSLVEYLAFKHQKPFIKVNTNQQTSIHDFVGTWSVKGGETCWIDGALPFAMKNGCWLLIDEVDYAEPAILSALNSVLEPGRTLMLKEKGNEIIKAHEDFRIFVTGNTLGQMSEHRGLYQGTNLMNEAFIDRFKLYIVDYLPEELEVKVLTDTITLMTENVAKEMVKVAAAIRKSFVEETVMCSFSTRRLLDWAEMMIHHRDMKREAPFHSAEATIFSKISKEDKVVVKGIIQRVLLGRG